MASQFNNREALESLRLPGILSRGRIVRMERGEGHGDWATPVLSGTSTLASARGAPLKGQGPEQSFHGRQHDQACRDRGRW